MRILALIIISGILAGCNTGLVGKHYVQLSTPEASQNLTKLGRWEAPQYHLSHQIQQDVETLRASGYVILGTSHFSHYEFSYRQITKQAAKVGATHVLYSRTLPGNDYLGDLPEFGMLNDGSDDKQPAPAAFIGFAAAAQELGKIDIGKIVTTGGSSNSSSNNNNNYYDSYHYNSYGSTTIINRTVYNYQTYFIGKREDHENYFGLTLGDYDGDGAVISNVMSGSVATKLNLKKLDIITSINGTPVLNREDALKKLSETDELSKQTTLFIRRENEDFISVIPPLLAAGF